MVCTAKLEQEILTIPPGHVPPTHHDMTCDRCGFVNHIPLFRAGIAADNKPRDWAYFAELLLVTNVKGEVMYARNLEQVLYMKEYIQSAMQRTEAKRKYGAISNLPKFMKKAKNRKHVPKGLEELERIAIAAEN